MSYNILTDALPDHFVYYAVDKRKTACKLLMMPSKPKGADLSSVSELFAIAVFIDATDVIFKRMPKMSVMSVEEVNELITITKPKPMQVQKLLNVTTNELQKTKSIVSPTINYTIASISKIVKDSKDKNVASYLDDPIYRNNQRFDADGNAITTDLTIDDFIDGGESSKKYEDVFYLPPEKVNGIVVVKVFDKHGKRIQVSYKDGVLTANDVLMLGASTPYYMDVTLSDGTNTKTEQIPVFQRDSDGERPTTFFDTFGNTVVGIESNMLKVKRTRLPLSLNDDSQPIMIDIKKSTLENKRLLDVISGF
jgi:glycosyltransferase A (GT-A) superfamily protein (DUF2064 family)